MQLGMDITKILKDLPQSEIGKTEGRAKDGATSMGLTEYFLTERPQFCYSLDVKIYHK